MKPLVLAMLLLIVAPPALATLDTLQPFGGPVVKTNRLETSDFCPSDDCWPTAAGGEQGDLFIFDLHFGTSYLNWAGVKFNLTWDADEVNFLGLTPSAGFVLAGVNSAGPSSLIATILHMSASISGIPVFNSSTFNLFTVSFHATNTTPISNSDIDIWLSAASQVFHTSLSSYSFVASLIAAPGGIGVEHVPEPATAVLVLGGLGLLAAGRRLGVKQ